jgi:hypothetical protein
MMAERVGFGLESDEPDMWRPFERHTGSRSCQHFSVRVEGDDLIVLARGRRNRRGPQSQPLYWWAVRLANGLPSPHSSGRISRKCFQDIRRSYTIRYTIRLSGPD